MMASALWLNPGEELLVVPGGDADAGGARWSSEVILFVLFPCCSPTALGEAPLHVLV